MELATTLYLPPIETIGFSPLLPGVKSGSSLGEPPDRLPHRRLGRQPTVRPLCRRRRRPRRRHVGRAAPGRAPRDRAGARDGIALASPITAPNSTPRPGPNSTRPPSASRVYHLLTCPTGDSARRRHQCRVTGLGDLRP